MELANLLFIQAKKPGSYLFGLGSKEVLGVFLAEGRFYIRRCIHLNGPLHWSPFKFMWMDKTQRSKRVILTWTSHMNNLKINKTLEFSFLSVTSHKGLEWKTHELHL